MELNNTKLKEETIKKYREVLNKNKNWGNGYWDDDLKGKERAKICIQYLCEIILKFEDRDYEYKITKSMFNRYKLANMIKKLYEDDPYKAVVDTFPEKAGMIFRQQNRIHLKKEILELIPEMHGCVKTRQEVIEKIILYYDCKEKDIPKMITYITLLEFNLKDILAKYYSSSVFKLIEEVRPGVFKPWEFVQENGNAYLFGSYSKELPKGYFEEKNNRLDAVVWVLHRFQADGRKIKDLNITTLKEYGLFSLLEYYKYSIFSMIEEFAAGKTRPWQFKEPGTKAYWNSNPHVAKEGILFLIKKLGLTKEDFTNLTLKDFENNYLDCMLYANYSGFIFSAINDIYPNEFIHMKWQFKDIPNQLFYCKDNRKEAIRDLVEKMKLREEDIPFRLNREVLISKGLKYIIDDVHKGNIFLVINEVYPNKFKKESFLGLQKYVEEYIDIFKDSIYTKLSFTDKTDEDIRVGLTKLSEIFTINKNSWVGQKKLKPFIQELGDLEILIYKELIKGNISIFEFETDEPKGPKDESEITMFDNLARHSRAKYLNIVWLYWRAYTFFKHFKLQLRHESVYMGLEKEGHHTASNSYYNFEEGKEYYLKETIEKYNTIVRCGELEVERLFLELHYGVDCVWIFPFEENPITDEEDKEYSYKYKAYLLQFNHDSIKAVYNTMNLDYEALQSNITSKLEQYYQ